MFTELTPMTRYEAATVAQVGVGNLPWVTYEHGCWWRAGPAPHIACSGLGSG